MKLSPRIMRQKTELGMVEDGRAALRTLLRVMVMVLSDVSEHSCMFFFSQVQVPCGRHRESGELSWSRLKVGQGGEGT